MLRNSLAALVATACLVSTMQLPASAAFEAYLKVKGAKQGEIKGSVTKKGQEDTIEAFSVDHEIVSPRDPQSGLPTGQRMHKPLTVKIAIDKATPLLWNAMVNNESLPEVTLDFYAPGAGGQVAQAFSIKLTNAVIAEMHLHTGPVAQASMQKLESYEEVAFTYQKIEWTWQQGNVRAADDWQSRP